MGCDVDVFKGPYGWGFRFVYGGRRRHHRRLHDEAVMNSAISPHT